MAFGGKFMELENTILREIRDPESQGSNFFSPVNARQK